MDKNVGVLEMCSKIMLVTMSKVKELACIFGRRRTGRYLIILGIPWGFITDTREV
jgi:hypothetical protein